MTSTDQVFGTVPPARVWYMNADFEMELAAPMGMYRRRAAFQKINLNLTKHLLWLSSPGDALLVDQGGEEALRNEADRRGVRLVYTSSIDSARTLLFTPWGWTASAVEVGKRIGAIVEPVSPNIIKRVNSKLWSFALEQELGVEMPGARAASTFEELTEAARRACPGIDGKWVIKSHLGFAARDRVLGRGPLLEGPSATWARRRIANGETLIFQPWLKVIREYGTAIIIETSGKIKIVGVSDLQTNGAGTGIGYLLGRDVDSGIRRELEEVSIIIGERLFREGYIGPAGIDSLEHTGGLHPVLEINARYTMGFVALAVERTLKPTVPVLWSIK